MGQYRTTAAATAAAAGGTTTINLSDAMWTKVDPNSAVTAVSATSMTFADLGVPSNTLPNLVRWDGDGSLLTTPGFHLLRMEFDGTISKQCGAGIGIAGDTWHHGAGIYAANSDDYWTYNHTGPIASPSVYFYGQRDDDMRVVTIALYVSADDKFAKLGQFLWHDASMNLEVVRDSGNTSTIKGIGANPRVCVWAYPTTAASPTDGSRALGIKLTHLHTALT